MNGNPSHLRPILMLAVAVCGALVGGMAQPSQPTVTLINFPSSVPTSQSARGLLSYQNARGGVESVVFDVVDGRYQRVRVEANRSEGAGQVPFELDCTSFAQEIVLRATLIDGTGQPTLPQLLKFTCGRPPFYNYSQEQARVRPTTETIRVHFFILDDGVTALTEGASPTEFPLISQPSAKVVDTIREAVVPALTGIWDQCSLAFKLGEVLIVHPERVQLPQGALDSLLFTGSLQARKIAIDARSDVFLTSAQNVLFEELRRMGVFVGLDSLFVFVVGSSIEAVQNGESDNIEGFGQLSSPPQGSSLLRSRYTLVRWGAVYDEGTRPITPKQVVSTLAHELGHNLGLDHPGHDGLSDTLSDDNNLMKGSGVTPETRANLLNSQCQVFLRLWSEMRRQAKAMALNIKPGRGSAPDGSVAFSTPQANDFERGYVELRNATEFALQTNDVHPWVVMVSAESDNLGASQDGNNRRALDDVLIRFGRGDYVPLSRQGSSLASGANGAYAFSANYRLRLDPQTHRQGDYGVHLLYTLIAR